MELVTVKNKYQIVIPQVLRNQIGINVGDLLEAKVEKGKITFTPKSVFDRELEKRLAKSMEDFEAGRSYGPFDTHEEAIKFLHSSPSEKRKYLKKK